MYNKITTCRQGSNFKHIKFYTRQNLIITMLKLNYFRYALLQDSQEQAAEVPR